MAKPPTTVAGYIAQCPPEVRRLLRTVRATLRKAAPRAEERLSYRMPALFQNGVLVYFGAFKHHLGLFPPVNDPALRARVAPYAGPKGNLRFPWSEPMPHRLLAAIVRSRVRANARRAAPRRPRTKLATARR